MRDYSKKLAPTKRTIGAFAIRQAFAAGVSSEAFRVQLINNGVAKGTVSKATTILHHLSRSAPDHLRIYVDDVVSINKAYRLVKITEQAWEIAAATFPGMPNDTLDQRTALARSIIERLG